MRYLIVFLTALLLFSCEEEKKQITADEIINRAIDSAGGDLYKNANIQFKFRENIYRSTRHGGEFTLERIKKDSVYTYRDVVNNTGFERYVNDSLVKIADTTATKNGRALNSVQYFAHLPYGLNDKAVNKQLVGETTLKGEDYYKLKVTFVPEGGGPDHHDEFMYWVNKKTFYVDYLAYKFHVNDGGIRFRVAFDPRIINGIRFVDYENYTLEDYNTKLSDLDQLYMENKLKLLSVIQTEDVKVEIDQ